MVTLSSIKEAIEPIWNWRKHPKGVLLWAIPLFILGMFFLSLRAILEYIYHDDPWFLVILLGGCILGFVALRPAYVLYRNMEKINGK